MFKKIILFYVVIITTNSFGQSSVNDYLLNSLNKKKSNVNSQFSGTSTTFFKHSNSPQHILGNQKTDKIDAYSFKLNNYNPVISAKDNWCQIYFRKDKLYCIQISLFFNQKDSIDCVDAFEGFINQCMNEADYQLISQGTSEKLIEISHGKELDISHSTKTPLYIFFKDKTKKESIKTSYRLSGITNEYELTITYLNEKYI